MTVDSAGTVRVRPARLPDAAAIAAIYAPYVGTTSITFEETAPTADEVARRMRAQPNLPWFVAEADGRVAGYCYASAYRTRAAYRWAVDVAIYLHPDAHRRGIGRALLQRLLQTLIELGYVSAFAGIALPNAASVGLHESLGFMPVGIHRSAGYKLGAWHDVGWWQLQLTPPPRHPEEPRPWHTVE